MSPGETLFTKVAALTGSNPRKALQVSRAWRSILKSEPGWAYRTRAAGQRIQGQWRAAGDSFRLAAQHGSTEFGIGAVDSYARAGRHDLALQAAKRLKPKLSGELKGRLLVNLGNAYLWVDDYRGARKAFREALALLPDGDLIVANAKVGQSTAELYGGSPETALQLAQEVQTAFEEADLDYYARMAEINVAQAHILMGKAEQAWLRLRRIIDQDPGFAAEDARTHEFLADAEQALNLTDAARASYRKALDSAELPRLNRANCLLALARLDNDPKLARKAARAFRQLRNEPWALAADLINARSLPELQRIESQLRFHGAKRWLAEARLKRSVSTRLPYPDLEGRRLAARAKTLRDHRRVFSTWLTARAEVSTQAVALRFFSDKETGLTRYLETLLAKPTPARIAEARQVILETRAVTLLDEILAAGPPDPKVREALDLLRAEAAQDRSPHTRRGGISHGAAPLIVRETAQQIAREDVGAAVFWQGESGLYRLGPQLDRLNLEDKLKWLEFELMTSDDPECVTRLAEECVNLIGALPRQISPDGVLWSAPWALIAPASLLCLSPAFRGNAGPLRPGRIVVWHGDSEDLPAAREEVDSLLVRFPQAEIARTADEARKSLRGDISLLHVAGHARFNRENPMLSSIQFPDSPLYAVELSQIDCRIDLAVLSACDTGALSLSTKSEPDGFVRAALARGARSAVAAQWPLHDQTAGWFMNAMYHKLANGAPLDEALTHARAIVRTERPHPRDWASLVLFGGYVK